MKVKSARPMPLRGRRAPRPTVLISGFGPFPGIPFNASAELAASAAHRSGHPGSQVVFHSGLLPTSWEAGPDRASRLIRELRPDAIVHFGVASSATPDAIGMVLSWPTWTVCALASSAGCGAYSSVMVGKPREPTATQRDMVGWPGTQRGRCGRGVPRP